MEGNCSSDPCQEPSKQKCGGCNTAKYCSKDCQITDWKVHKRTCTAAQKHNCFVIRAAPKSDAPVLENIPVQIEPLPLQRYGNEGAEKQELKARLGWKSAGEVGKFYDHAGTTDWYYYVYGDTAASAATHPLNEISQLTCYGSVHGDIAVIRSGPYDAKYPETFTHGDLAKAVEFYKTNSRDEVFAQRESSRFGRNMGIDLSGVSYYNGSW